MRTCEQPIELEALAAYWLGELDEAAEAPLEEHLFGCAHCTRRLEWLAACAWGVRAAVRDGAIALSLTASFLEHMKRAGMRIREYPVAPGGTVNCTIRAEDDAVVSRLKAPLAGVRRVDELRSLDLGDGRIQRWRLEDVPFDPQAGEVLFSPAAAALRKLPANTLRVQLLAVDEAGDRRVRVRAYTGVSPPGPRTPGTRDLRTANAVNRKTDLALNPGGGSRDARQD